MTTTETNSNGAPRQRPAKRRTLDKFLERRTDLARLLSEACEEKRNRLLNDLETEVEKIALGPGQIDRQFDKKTGAITSEKHSVREKLYAILQLLKAHDRERYGDQRRVEVEGQVDHRHAHAHLVGGTNAGGYTVDFASVQAALSEDESRTLMAFLERIENARIENARRERAQKPALPPGETA